MGLKYIGIDPTPEQMEKIQKEIEEYNNNLLKSKENTSTPNKTTKVNENSIKN